MYQEIDGLRFQRQADGTYNVTFDNGKKQAGTLEQEAGFWYHYPPHQLKSSAIGRVSFDAVKYDAYAWYKDFRYIEDMKG